MNNLNFPILTTKLLDKLPHRPPMVWVDEVISVKVSAQGVSGRCLIELKSDRHFFNSLGKIRPSAAIEWIAQAYGFVKACQNVNSKNSPNRAYLVGVSECSIDFSEIENETSVIVEVEEVRELPPACIVAGKLCRVDGKRIFGEARIKVFADDGSKRD